MLPFLSFDTVKFRTLLGRIAPIVYKSLNPYAKFEGLLFSYSVIEPKVLQ